MAENKNPTKQIVRCYENQRYFPLVGFSKQLLPTDPYGWADITGKKAARREDFVLQLGWDWLHDWKVEINEETDAQGWQFGIDFGWKLSKQKGSKDFVRRRCWWRTMTMLNADASSVYQATLTTPVAPGHELLPRSPSPQPGAGHHTHTHEPDIPGESAYDKFLRLKEKEAEDSKRRAEEKEREEKERGSGEKKFEAITMSCYENQRFYPVLGWSQKMLPTDRAAWSDEEGKSLSREDCEAQLRDGWRWQGEWTVDTNASTDAEGWMFAVDFPQADWQKTNARCFVRRRKWMRRQTAGPDRRQWGVPLEKVRTTLVSGYTAPIPSVLLKMKAYLLSHGGLDVPSIFRISPDTVEVEKVRDEISENVFSKCSDIHCVAHLLKIWFRELPQPLLHSIDAEQIAPEMTPELAGELLSQVPEPNKSITTWLLDLLVQTAQKSAANKMTADTLALVFGPNLMSVSREPSTMLAQTRKFARFLTQAIEFRRRASKS